MINNPIIKANNRNVSAYNGAPPKGSASRFIGSGPLYDKQQVSELCKKEQINFFTKAAVRDARNLSLEIPELAKLIQRALNEGKYENSQWCQKEDDGPWAACDSYEIEIYRFMLPECEEILVKLYVKFAISKSGATLFSISNHREGT